MKKVIVIGMSVVCLITLGITFSNIGIIQKQSIVENTQKQNSDGKQRISVSWVSYENEEDMIANTELIVVGKVVGTNNKGKAKIELMLREDLSPEKKKEMSEDFVGYNPVTISDVLIEDVLKGDAKIGDTIQAQQLGGIDGDTEFVVNDVKHLENGQTYLLFLKRALLDGENRYYIQNPIDSVIQIQGSKSIKRPDTKMFKNINSTEELKDSLKNSLQKSKSSRTKKVEKDSSIKKIENTTDIIIGYGSNNFAAQITPVEIKQLEDLFNGAEFAKSDASIQQPYLNITFYGKESTTSFNVDDKNIIQLRDGSCVKSEQISFKELYSIYNKYLSSQKKQTEN